MRSLGCRCQPCTLVNNSQAGDSAFPHPKKPLGTIPREQSVLPATSQAWGVTQLLPQGAAPKAQHHNPAQCPKSQPCPNFLPLEQGVPRSCLHLFGDGAIGANAGHLGPPPVLTAGQIPVLPAVPMPHGDTPRVSGVCHHPSRPLWRTQDPSPDSDRQSHLGGTWRVPRGHGCRASRVGTGGLLFTSPIPKAAEGPL